MSGRVWLLLSRWWWWPAVVVAAGGVVESRAVAEEPATATATSTATGSPRGLVAPAPLERVDAVYPAGEGQKVCDVTLAVEVAIDGAVGGMSVAGSCGAAFDAAAMAAAARWRFSPATRDGRAIASRIRLVFHFEPPVVVPVPAASPNAAAPSPPPAAAPAGPASSPERPSSPAATPGGAAAPVVPATGGSQVSAGGAAAEAKGGEPVTVEVVGRRAAPSRGVSDFDVKIGALGLVPRASAAEALKLAPGVLLQNDGGEGHAEQIYLRGFDAREGQDIEMSAGGVPINEAGNLHGNGYADSHFLLPELITGLRLLEGPYDPRQGNFAVAGSVDFALGLPERGLTTKLTYGSFNTERLLLLYGPGGASSGTFAGGELYQTDGFGQNRDGRRGSVIAQYEGRTGAHSFRVGAQAYVASFHSAGLVRQDDYNAGRVCFYCTYDPAQGADASRYSVWGDHESHLDHLVIKNTVFGIARPMRLRENFTGFLLDPQEPQQSTHGQRGDLLDLSSMAFTLGARGAARLSGTLLGQTQELEVGYFARGDFVRSTQTRLEAATGHPYHVDTDLDSRLGDIGLYLDANLRPLSWLALRGGVRADLFTYDVLNLCAAQSASPASRTNPPGDASCLSQQAFGAYREPTQRTSTSGLSILPRASLLLGPWYGLQASLSYGQGMRSIDPVYIVQDAGTPFATATTFDAGLAWARKLERPVELALRGGFFQTRVDRDLIFSQSAGRNVLGGASTRNGVVVAGRATGRFFDAAANLTWVHGTYDDTGLLIAYIPELVVRFDGALHGDIPIEKLRLRGRPFRGALTTGLGYTSPRPLPQGERGDALFTWDASATVGWWWLDLGVQVFNVLDARYRLGEYNYVSDFRSQAQPTLVPARMFSAGAPRTVLFSLAIHFGGDR